MSKKIPISYMTRVAFIGIALVVAVLLWRSTNRTAPLFAGSRAAGCSLSSPIACAPDSLLDVDSAHIGYHQSRSIALDFAHPRAVALDLDDRLYAGGDSLVYRLDPAGNIAQRFDPGNAIHAIALDESGRLYVAHRKALSRFSPDGSLQNRWIVDEPRGYLTSIAVGDDAIYAADAGMRLVWSFDTSGTLLRRIGERDPDRGIPGFIVPSAFMDVAIGRDGSLWVVNPGRHLVENYRPGGDRIGAWGEPGAHLEGFCGCCGPTHMALMPNGNFVTSEKGIVRVKVYSPAGEFLSVVAPPSAFNPRETGLDVAIDSRGTIYLVDTHEKSIRIFEKTKT